MNITKEVCRIPMILTVKKLLVGMTANEIVTLSSITDFDKDQSTSRPHINQSHGLRNRGHRGHLPALSPSLYKVPLFSFQSALSCLIGCP